jgi:hypothetical protein
MSIVQFLEPPGDNDEVSELVIGVVLRGDPASGVGVEDDVIVEVKVRVRNPADGG